MYLCIPSTPGAAPYAIPKKAHRKVGLFCFWFKSWWTAVPFTERLRLISLTLHNKLHSAIKKPQITLRVEGL